MADKALVIDAAWYAGGDTGITAIVQIIEDTVRIEALTECGTDDHDFVELSFDDVRALSELVTEWQRNHPVVEERRLEGRVKQ